MNQLNLLQLMHQQWPDMTCCWGRLHEGQDDVFARVQGLHNLAYAEYASCYNSQDLIGGRIAIVRYPKNSHRQMCLAHTLMHT